MDSSSRNRMSAPSNQQNPRQRAPDSTPFSTTPSVGEVNGRVDQLALVQQALQIGATPTVIAGFAMVIAQMQSQAVSPDVLLAITSSIGPLDRSASFRDGAWHGYDLTHYLIGPRSHVPHSTFPLWPRNVLYGEPTRPPMDQERSLRISPPTMQPPIQVFPPLQSQSHVPPAPVERTRVSCTLPVVPPPVLTPHALGVRKYQTTHTAVRQLHASFRLPGGRGAGECNCKQHRTKWRTDTRKSSRENSHLSGLIRYADAILL